MFAPNRHDRLIERQKTRYTWIPFQEYEINDFNEWSFISLPLLKLLADIYAPVHDLDTHGSLVRLSLEWSSM